MSAAEWATAPHIGDYDAIVIGGGIIGAMIGRELSKLQGRFAVLEKEAFPGFGVSKASLSQIHLPDFCPPGSLKGRLCRDAPTRFKKLARELDVLYREVDELWLALESAQVTDLKAAKARAESHGAFGFEIIGPQRIRALEPHVTPKAFVSRDGIQQTLRLGRELIPALSEKDVITSFSGILANSNMTRNGDFFIAPAEHLPGVIHVIVGAPGLSAAPAIAEYVVQLLMDAGWQPEEKADFNPRCRSWPRFESASMAEKKQMVNADPKYGHVLCRCEQVTEAEVLQSIHRGARTMDAVKHLTRAGMGRCQGGFCAPFVLKHLADELGIPPTRVTKKGPGSHQIVKMTKVEINH